MKACLVGIVLMTIARNIVAIEEAVNFLEEHSDKASTEPSLACPQVDLSPCSCNLYFDDQLILTCDKVQSDAELAAVFENEFPSTAFYSLEIENSPGVTSLGDILKGFTFRNLILSVLPNLKLIEEDFLSSVSENLEDIYLDFVATNSSLQFPFEMLPLLPNLRSLIFTRVPTLQLPQEITSDSIQVLFIEDCGLTEIPAGKYDVFYQYYILLRSCAINRKRCYLMANFRIGI